MKTSRAILFSLGAGALLLSSFTFLWYNREPIKEDERPIEHLSTLSQEEITQLTTNPAFREMISSVKEDKKKYPQVYNGTLGYGNQRLELYIKTVEADPIDPTRLHITGMDRYKKNVTSFSGYLKIDSALNQRQMTNGYYYYRQAKSVKPFSGDTFLYMQQVRGSYQLEESGDKGTGVFKGNFTLDFNKTKDGKKFQVNFWIPDETRRTGLLLDGAWTSHATGDTKPVLAGLGFFNLADDIMENFTIGGRSRAINPKYRDEGWDSFWAIDEWWNQPEKTVARGK